jgi:hypothetical protein
MKMGQLDPSLKLGSDFFFFRFCVKKKKRTRVSISGQAINAKVRREVANLLYLFILFTKIKKSVPIWSNKLNPLSDTEISPSSSLAPPFNEFSSPRMKLRQVRVIFPRWLSVCPNEIVDL